MPRSSVVLLRLSQALGDSKMLKTDAKANPQGFIQDFDNNPFHIYLGLTVAEQRKDYGRLRLQRTESTPTGIGGSVNGGVIATMIDMATIVAIFSDLSESTMPAGTADLAVTYLRQAHGEWIDAEALVIKRGRQLCSVEVSVINNEEVLCARGRVLYAMRSV
jgi:uncharacterized protein (TIGR00369 family)